MKHPQCGHCGYDLIGAESNRCPECGLLFIEAGVTFERDAGGGMRRIRRAVILSLVLVLGLGVAMSSMMYFRAQAARERAIAQQQAAMAQQRAALAKQQAAATLLAEKPGEGDADAQAPGRDANRSAAEDGINIMDLTSSDDSLINVKVGSGEHGTYFDGAIRKQDHWKTLYEIQESKNAFPDGTPRSD